MKTNNLKEIIRLIVKEVLLNEDVKGDIKKTYAVQIKKAQPVFKQIQVLFKQMNKLMSNEMKKKEGVYELGKPKWDDRNNRYLWYVNDPYDRYEYPRNEKLRELYITWKKQRDYLRYKIFEPIGNKHPEASPSIWWADKQFLKRLKEK